MGWRASRKDYTEQIAMRRTVMIAFSLIALAVSAPAQAAMAVCVVADPTGTPLNIRMQPNGETVARVRNGEKLLVFFEGRKTDSRGQFWYEVAMATSAAPDGRVCRLRPLPIAAPRADGILDEQHAF